MEIYNETLTDLLAEGPSQPLVISEEEGATVVKGLTVRLASTEEEALNLLFEGETNRVIAEHALNYASSRSHCVFTVHIESRSRTQSSSNFTLSKLNFVDLAGSERLGKTMSEGLTKQEAMYINKSLTFLEQVIQTISMFIRRCIAHIFSRDPISAFSNRIELDDEKDTDHFESLQSTNWQNMRFKPPPPDSDIGWRVEFRTIEAQLTDFENAAFVSFCILSSRALVSFNCNFYLPLSYVQENMKRAQQRNAVLDQKFYFR